MSKPISDNHPQALLTTDQAASCLGLKPSTLVTLRSRGGGPRYAKLGRKVMYDPRDLDEYIDARKVHNTLEAKIISEKRDQVDTHPKQARTAAKRRKKAPPRPSMVVPQEVSDAVQAAQEEPANDLEAIGDEVVALLVAEGMRAEEADTYVAFAFDDLEGLEISAEALLERARVLAKV